MSRKAEIALIATVGVCLVALYALSGWAGVIGTAIGTALGCGLAHLFTRIWP